jgi:hypothetical protein
MKCNSCNTVIYPNSGNKFCENCGKEIPTNDFDQSAVLPIGEEKKNNDNQSTTIGKNSILSNSQINTTNTTVNNTTIEDDTKKSIVCAVSGKRVLYIESVCCLGCKKDVSTAYYNELTKRCDNCHQSNLHEYKSALISALENGIDKNERLNLNLLAKKLNLTENEKQTIEQDLNDQFSLDNHSSGDLTSMQKVQFSTAKKELIQKEELASSLIKLKAIYDRVDNNDQVSCLYFLNKALVSPDEYIVNFKASQYDVYWEHYWSFLAYLKKGDSQSADAAKEKAKRKYKSNKNDFLLSEVLLFIRTYSIDRNPELIDFAKDTLFEIEPNSNDFLFKLHKFSEQLVSKFDSVRREFKQIDEPDEPGLIYYYNFFLKHLYGIEIAVDKIKLIDNVKSNSSVNSTPPLPGIKNAPQIDTIRKNNDSVRNSPPLPGINSKVALPNTNKPTVPNVYNDSRIELPKTTNKLKSPPLPKLPNTDMLPAKKPPIPPSSKIPIPMNTKPPLPQGKK